MRRIVHKRHRVAPEEQPLYGPGSPRQQKAEDGKRREPEPERRPADLYKQTAEYRRVLFLEAVARAIVEMEQCRSREEWEKLAQELRDVRAATWGRRPWRKAPEPEAFEQHVLDLARAFTGRPAVYPNRSRQPLAVVYDYTPGAKVRVQIEEEDAA
jgi:hypothetical protein